MSDGIFTRRDNSTGLDDRSPSSLPLRLDHRPRRRRRILRRPPVSVIEVTPCSHTRSQRLPTVKERSTVRRKPQQIIDNFCMFGGPVTHGASTPRGLRVALSTTNYSREECYRYAPHKDVSVDDGPHIQRWSHKIIILQYNIIILTIVLQLTAVFSIET